MNASTPFYIGDSIPKDFAPDENAKLEFLSSYLNNWCTIADHFQGRTPRQLKEQHDLLTLKKSIPKWTKEDEALLEKKFYELGPRWSKLAFFFPERSENNLRAHWEKMKNRKNDSTEELSVATFTIPEEFPKF
ncbi:Myb-like DNA-binding domain containing protein [Tritrichomonas foetus]|uniref:Myb-like DNA-binding domain containing protein n=1 Tax=Tritrichomonas foetus TaxID=1144522 RepID=A0A1J4KZM8_9EUKA|nr:Myb-like DNA-binding domain containing protein [Tritrichomonas foetus]|eukprot:OHT16610.1 Myb-like DNA-binding domain containing protein [Tritrichomonas foetus]